MCLVEFEIPRGVMTMKPLILPAIIGGMLSLFLNLYTWNYALEYMMHVPTAEIHFDGIVTHVEKQTLSMQTRVAKQPLKFFVPERTMIVLNGKEAAMIDLKPNMYAHVVAEEVGPQLFAKQIDAHTQY
jgi:hypothetical protein